MGVKVVDLPDPESGLSENHSSDLEGPLSVDLLRSRSVQLTSAPNAMESLMDQGIRISSFLASLPSSILCRRPGGVEVTICE